jgi:hypothetical protein
MLDELIRKELLELKYVAEKTFQGMDKSLRAWMARRPQTAKRMEQLEAILKQRKLDQQEILLERIRDKAHAEVYTEMLTACETDIAELVKQIDELRDMDETVKQRKKDMKKSIDLLDDILKDGHISDTHLRMLVEEIKIFQNDGKLRVVITLNGTFRTHFDYYNEVGEMIRREAELWYEQVSEGEWMPIRNEDEMMAKE